MNKEHLVNRFEINRSNDRSFYNKDEPTFKNVYTVKKSENNCKISDIYSH